MSLSEHMKQTADLMAGYTVGRLIVEDNAVSLQLDRGGVLLLSDEHCVEVRNGALYEAATLDVIRSAKTAEGWPLLAGIYARVKQARNSRLARKQNEN